MLQSRTLHPPACVWPSVIAFGQDYSHACRNARHSCWQHSFRTSASSVDRAKRLLASNITPSLVARARQGTSPAPLPPAAYGGPRSTRPRARPPLRQGSRARARMDPVRNARRYRHPRASRKRPPQTIDPRPRHADAPTSQSRALSARNGRRAPAQERPGGGPTTCAARGASTWPGARCALGGPRGP